MNNSIGEFLNLIFTNLFQFLGDSAIFWAPPVLIFVGWELWLRYKNMLFISKMKWSLLEIRVPKDVFKSPLAMEIMLANAFYQTGGTGTWYDKYWLGKVRMWFSLEIISLGGKVYFLMKIPSQFRNIVETQIYAQYPQAEINEIDDYTDMIPPYEDKSGEWLMFGTEFTLTKADPYPIRTYIDYGLDRSVGQEEEQKIDPITPLIENLGSIGKDEQIWFQIIIRAATNRYPKKDGKFNQKQGWVDEAKALVKELKDKGRPKEKGEMPTPLTKGENEVISAIERSMDKMAFDCGMRAIYLGKKDVFAKANNITALTGMFKQFNSASLNGFKPKNVTGFDYPWQDPGGSRTDHLKREIFEQYKARSYFYHPHKKQPFLLTSEELATIYHFPGRVLETPTFKRLESKKSEPPYNLPV
ncbi:MAG: hypothetical protein WDK96_00350 [Candidatus Paceibacterota bacterium]|jgi:hypothetical protein